MDKFILRNQGKKVRSNSLGSLEEGFKRKREEERGDSVGSLDLVFKKSNIIKRSPEKTIKPLGSCVKDPSVQVQKVREEDSEEMELILKKLEVLQDIKEELREIKQNNIDLLKNQEEMKLEWAHHKKLTEVEIQNLKKTVDDLSAKVKNLEGREEMEDKRRRKNNIIVTEKVEEQIIEKPELHFQKLISTITKEEINIEDIIILVPKNKQGLRVTKIRLTNFNDKMKIMRNKGILKGKKIYIDDDLTKNEGEIQKKLRTRAKEEKEKGKKVKVGYNKIFIDNKWYSSADLIEQ